MRASKLYKKQSLQTASKEQITILLFRKALSNLNRLATGDWEEDQIAQFKLGENTLDILVELRQTLNHDVAPELCRQLEDLYNYIIARLAVGLTTSDPTPFEDSIRTLEPIADAFTTAAQQVKEQSGP